MTQTTCVCEEWGNYTEEEYQIFKKVLRRSVVYYEHDKDRSPVILRTDVMFMSKEIPCTTTMEQMFDGGRGYEHIAYCAHCKKGVRRTSGVDMKAPLGERRPRFIEESKEESDDDGNDDDCSGDDYEEAIVTNSLDETNPYQKRHRDRKMRIKLYVGENGNATDLRINNSFNTSQYCQYLDLIKERLEKEKEERLRKTREKLNKVLLSDDYLFMKEHNLL